MIVPRVRSSFSGSNECRLPCAITVSNTTPYTDKLCLLLSQFLPDASVLAADQAVILVLERNDLSSEQFRLTVSDNAVTVEASDYLGFRNAMAVLACMVRLDNECFVLQETVVEDAPAARFRSFMLDLARGMKDFDTVCEDLVLCAKARLNHVHLHLFDSMGCCVELSSLPREALWEGCYSKDQMRTLIELSDILGLELIPEFDMPGHSSTLLKALPEFRCVLPEDHHRSDWTICPSADGIYAFYEAVIQELAALFPGRYLHMGGDELDFADVPEIDQLCHWDDCERCRNHRQSYGLEDRQAQYYEFMNQIHNMVIRTGKQMIMWSDQLDCTRPIPLSRDILLQFWRVAAPGRGPYVGCSMNAQLAAGFQVINAFYPQTYVDLEEYASEETLQNWQWTKIPETDTQFHHNIVGGEACAWEYGNTTEYGHYDRTLPCSVLLFADKLWNGDTPDYSAEFRQAMTRSLLGAATPEGTDLFSCIGSVLPPRCDQLVYPERISASIQQLEQTLERLKQHTGKRARYYLPCLEAALALKG